MQPRGRNGMVEEQVHVQQLKGVRGQPGNLVHPSLEDSVGVR